MLEHGYKDDSRVPLISMANIILRQASNIVNSIILKKKKKKLIALGDAKFLDCDN